ncbi:TetR/AcrR family transcriptional regulator [Paraburkholderia dipogonis]|uniref:TetR/AcrR family transcriptional regulator n=1 Tax=Paraburkholderia dipogonis TaxID=1211383 RepID=UPI0038B904A0
MTRPSPGKTANDVVHIEVLAKPRKRPRQTRSIVLVDALKKTGRDILEKEGRDAVSLYRLSECAGVAVSSIYEYFPTIESLIGAIFEDYRAECRRLLLEDIQALPLSATLFDGILLALRSGIAALHKWSQIDPDFNVKSAYYDELVRLDLVKPEHFWSSGAMPALFARFPDEILVHDREKAQFLVNEVLLASLRVIALKKPAYLGEADTSLLLARMLHALLTTAE